MLKYLKGLDYVSILRYTRIQKIDRVFPEYVFPHVAHLVWVSLSLSPFPKANPYTVVPKSPRLPVRGTLEYCRYFPSRVLRRAAFSRFSAGMSFTRDVPFDMYQYLFWLPSSWERTSERDLYIYNIFDFFHISQRLSSSKVQKFSALTKVTSL